MISELSRRRLNALFFLLMVAVNVLANVIPIGNFNTGQISAMYPTLITPPGWTFLIWTAIYAMFAVIIGKQLLHDGSGEQLNIGLYFIASCILNIFWIFAWHTQHMIVAAVTILALLAVLLKLYILTRENGTFTKAAFSIYYAWITVASVIMIFAAVKMLAGNAPITPIVPRSFTGSDAAAGITGTVSALSGKFTGIILMSGTPVIVSYVTVYEYIMAVIALIVITFITAVHIRMFHDIVYVAVILWALAGILIRQITSVTPPVIFLIVCGASIAVTVYLTIKTMAGRSAE